MIEFDKWIRHDGAGCPLPRGARVEVECRNGYRHFITAGTRFKVPWRDLDEEKSVTFPMPARANASQILRAAKGRLDLTGKALHRIEPMTWTVVGVAAKLTLEILGGPGDV